MKKYMIFLVVLLMASCLGLKDAVYIGNLRKDVYFIENFDQNKKHAHYLVENGSDFAIIELSNKGSWLPPKAIEFYDAETEELLFSYTAEDLKKIRGEIKKRKPIQGAFLLTDNGVIYVDTKELRRIEDSLKRHNKW